MQTQKCPYCGQNTVRKSGRRADYEALLPLIGISRNRCTNCDRRFYRFLGIAAMRAPSNPRNVLTWLGVSLVVYLVCAYLYSALFFRR